MGHFRRRWLYGIRRSVGRRRGAAKSQAIIPVGITCHSSRERGRRPDLCWCFGSICTCQAPWRPWCNHMVRCRNGGGDPWWTTSWRCLPRDLLKRAGRWGMPTAGNSTQHVGQRSRKSTWRPCSRLTPRHGPESNVLDWRRKP